MSLDRDEAVLAFDGIDWAGSITSIAPALRREVARWLSGQGLWTHLDVIDDSYAPDRGVSIASIAELVHAGPIDVHLMVANPVDSAVLFTGLGISRLTVQVEDLDTTERSPADICGTLRARSEAAALWLAIAPETEPAVLEPYLSDVDGVLYLLAPPGIPDVVADPLLLDRVRSNEHRLPTGVDGGVTAELAYQAVLAGASYLVSGRAFLGEGSNLESKTALFCSTIRKYIKESTQ